MKVKDLKKKLSKLPDDMDVKILLPEVEDWADVKTEEIHLKKLKHEVNVEMINSQNKQLNEEYNLGRKTDYTVDDRDDIGEWEIHGHHLESEVKTMYDFKEALLLKPKSRGKSTFDRYGNIEY